MLTPLEQREVLDAAKRMATMFVRARMGEERAKLNAEPQSRFDSMRRRAVEEFKDFLKEL